MDEYLIDDGGGHLHPPPLDAHFSVAGFAARETIGPLNAAGSPGRGIDRHHFWHAGLDNPAGFDERLAAAGGIDLFILASGDSGGHIAFNPPGSDANCRTAGRATCRFYPPGQPEHVPALALRWKNCPGTG